MKTIFKRKSQISRYFLTLSTCFAVQAQAGTIHSQILKYKQTLSECNNTPVLPTDPVCRKKLSSAFQNIEESFLTCGPQSDERAIASASTEDCESLEKFISEDFLYTSPSLTQISKALKFINVRTHMNNPSTETNL